MLFSFIRSIGKFFISFLITNQQSIANNDIRHFISTVQLIIIGSLMPITQIDSQCPHFFFSLTLLSSVLV